MIMKKILVSLAIAAVLPACGGAQAETKPDPKPVQQTQAAAGPKADSVQGLIADAGKLLRDGKPQEAKAKYNAALKKEPQNFDARLGEASCDIKLGNYDAAKTTLDALKKERPESREVVILTGVLLTQKGDYEAGIDLYKGQLAKYEKNGEEPDPDLLNNLIVLYRLNKSYDDGEKTCRTLLARDPGNVDALKNLSLIYFDQEKYALAETIAINSLKLKDNDAALYNNRGMIRVKRNRYPEAVSFFKKAVEIDPTLISAHLNLGSIALRYRDYNTAAVHYGEAMKLEPRHAEANLGYGFALSGQQKANEAIAQLQRALEIDGGAARAFAEIAMIQKLQLNNVDAAAQWCGKYKAAKGTLDAKDPVKADCDNIDLEIKNRESAKAAMEKMKAAEDAENAKKPPPPPPAPAPAPAPAAAAPAPAAAPGT
jgi:tetratricopeptide (TPR) repeat protein